MPRSHVGAGILVLLVAIAAGAYGQSAREAPDSPTQARALRATRPEVPWVHGVVTAGHPLASMAGLRMLMKGGTAADAAVATMATLNLTELWASGAGGNGFLLFYEKKTGKTYSLAFTGAAPKALKAQDMRAETLLTGAKAGVIPGAFGGWIAVLDRFGKLSLKDVLEPAIEYAEKGHPIDPSIAGNIQRQASALQKFPTSAAIFLPNGKPPVGGELFRDLPLAQTFRKVVAGEQKALSQGKSRSEALQAAYDVFYNGEIAQEFDRFFREQGGLITAEDLHAYKPRWGEPVHTTYRGYDVYSSPATSRGGIEVMMQLNLIEGFDLARLGHNSAQTLHLIAESIKLAKSDIYRYVADPAFITIPLAGMLSKEYAAQRRALIDPAKAIAYPEPGEPNRFSRATAPSSNRRQQPDVSLPRFDERSVEGDTTSFTIADSDGNVLACTPTLGGGFGTEMVVGNTGILLNNGLRIGSTAPYPDNVNYVRGGQIPLLGNSPVMVLKDGHLVAAFGTPGGETVGQTEFQMVLNLVDFGIPIQQAIEAARIALDADPNFYKPGAQITMQVESRIKPEIVEALEAMGHHVRLTAEYSIGSIQGILVNPKTGALTAGADIRRTAYAVGW